jgi:hypothetical protein
VIAQKKGAEKRLFLGKPRGLRKPSMFDEHWVVKVSVVVHSIKGVFAVAVVSIDVPGTVRVTFEREVADDDNHQQDKTNNKIELHSSSFQQNHFRLILVIPRKFRVFYFDRLQP